MSLTVDYKGGKLVVDEDGFLQEPEKWDHDVAQCFAKFENIEGELTPDHWKVLDYLRNYYVKYSIAPPVRMICKNTGFDLKRIYELFPSGPAKGACKLAGLPKPTGCV